MVSKPCGIFNDVKTQNRIFERKTRNDSRTSNIAQTYDKTTIIPKVKNSSLCKTVERIKYKQLSISCTWNRNYNGYYRTKLYFTIERTNVSNKLPYVIFLHRSLIRIKFCPSLETDVNALVVRNRLSSHDRTVAGETFRNTILSVITTRRKFRLHCHIRHNSAQSRDKCSLRVEHFRETSYECVEQKSSSRPRADETE